MVIRPCSEADLSELLRIEQACTAFPWSERQLLGSLQAADDCLGLEDGSGLLGFCIFSQVLDEACLLNIAVHPDRQGSGLGRRLLQFGLNRVIKAGARSCYLEVRVSNLGAQALYRSMGFQEVGCRKAYYPAVEAREDALIMSRDLPAAELEQV